MARAESSYRLTVLENRFLRGRDEKLQNDRENYIIRNFMVHTPHQMLLKLSNQG
jgi:hypothetical protein